MKLEFTSVFFLLNSRRHTLSLTAEEMCLCIYIRVAPFSMKPLIRMFFFLPKKHLECEFDFNTQKRIENSFLKIINFFNHFAWKFLCHPNMYHTFFLLKFMSFGDLCDSEKYKHTKWKQTSDKNYSYLFIIWHKNEWSNFIDTNFEWNPKWWSSGSWPQID
jgi:hypothetical protein